MKRISRPSSRVAQSRGFTLIELLIVVAIIGIIAAILIPNLIDALHKAKQKRTMADMKLAGTSWFSWLTDQYSAAAAGAAQSIDFNWSDFDVKTYDQIRAELVPQYTAELPRLDGWKTSFEYGATPDLEAPIPVGIRSAGSDKTYAGDTYAVGGFVSTDYVQDIVWAGGFFIRWPSGLQ